MCRNESIAINGKSFWDLPKWCSGCAKRLPSAVRKLIFSKKKINKRKFNWNKLKFFSDVLNYVFPIAIPSRRSFYNLWLCLCHRPNGIKLKRVNLLRLILQHFQMLFLWQNKTKTKRKKIKIRVFFGFGNVFDFLPDQRYTFFLYPNIQFIQIVHISRVGFIIFIGQFNVRSKNNNRMTYDRRKTPVLVCLFDLNFNLKNIKIFFILLTCSYFMLNCPSIGMLKEILFSNLK